MPDKYAEIIDLAQAVGQSPIGDWRHVTWEGVRGPIHGIGVYCRDRDAAGDPLAQGFSLLVMEFAENDQTHEMLQPYCTETYHVGAGHVELLQGRSRWVMSYGESYRLEPGTPHTVRANGPATLIVVSIPKREDYPDAKPTCVDAGA